jgi:2-oxoglutarate ferredoxin oxidoreductase subunit delta
LGEKVFLLAKRFAVTIDKLWCKGCGLCVGICPKKVLELDERMKSEPARLGDCIGCRQCENVCPDFAITVKESE